MGAWIEICHKVFIVHIAPPVAPLVGAWIEIVTVDYKNGVLFVAPLVGAWIEIFNSGYDIVPIMSLPSWERGLKYSIFPPLMFIELSLPSWERGLKL